MHNTRNGSSRLFIEGMGERVKRGSDYFYHTVETAGHMWRGDDGSSLLPQGVQQAHGGFVFFSAKPLFHGLGEERDGFFRF